MENLLDRITLDVHQCNGKPTIRHKRITVNTILEYLSAGESYEEIIENYPTLEKKDIDACIAWAAKLMNRNYIIEYA